MIVLGGRPLYYVEYIYLRAHRQVVLEMQVSATVVTHWEAGGLVHFCDLTRFRERVVNVPAKPRPACIAIKLKN